MNSRALTLLFEVEGNVVMCLVNNHAMNSRGIAKVYIHTFVISVVDGSCHLYDLTFYPQGRSQAFIG